MANLRGWDGKIYADVYSDGSVLCVAEVKQVHEDGFSQYDGGKILRCIEEKRANERLIASAPDMYNFISRFVNIADDARKILSRIEGDSHVETENTEP